MGWIANVFILIGLLQIGNKKRSAFLWTTLGEGLWSVYGFQRGMSDLGIICAVFSVVSIWNWRKWGYEC